MIHGSIEGLQDSQAKVLELQFAMLREVERMTSAYDNNSKTGKGVGSESNDQILPLWHFCHSELVT